MKIWKTNVIEFRISDNYLKPTKLPLILVALPEYHNLFRKISRNSFLLDEGIKTNYDMIS